jgi:hypothetical protein
MKIAPYVPGKDSVEGKETIAKLSSNEGALGPSPKAMAAYAKAAAELHRYPDGGAEKLRAAIGRHYGLDAQRIVCGAGSDELLNLLVRAYCGPGDELLYTQYGFLMYPINALGVGATPVAAPEKDYRADVDALLAKVTDKTRVVCLAARRPAEERPAGDRRGLCRVCEPQRLRIGRRAGRPGRERRDDPHLLQDLRPGRAAARLDVWPGRHRRRHEPAAPAVQRQPGGADRRHRRAG